ncbi:hypothetical protein H310_13262 [Aphanomyces invadans]|uniref:MalT-like TPR region domain-containing protein n=1 Tax=Aphanomyces invadans TaxID=157072 RepID=A0A024TGA5_9STRA|nr:hypothetical protein H310_13262 [Aphanomyces invadans]ETV92362.1 hypothetical protein H310_13262 [Aphanomyces invadans]|eukprot:XP_008878913.1 hypothetical protein H310_13262 [Aphanomyces invadans]
MVFLATTVRRAAVKAASARPTVVSRSFATSVRPANSAILQQLEMFPEFKESADACNKHLFDRAVAPLTRMLQVCDTISPALAVEAAWELGKVHARLGHVEEAVRYFQRDVVHGTEQSVRVQLAHGDGAAALVLAGALPSPSKEVYKGIAQYVLSGDVVLPESHDAISSTIGVSVNKANYAALAAASDLSSLGATSSQPLEASPASHSHLDEAVALWNDLVEALPSQDGLTRADLSFLASILTNLGEVYLAQGRTEDAMNILGQALKRNEAVPSQPLELARTLGLLAIGYHRLGQAVSSEGLFSSSLDKFEAATQLSRVHTVAYAKTLVGYGHLLKQWEKREADGDAKLAKGNALLGHDSWVTLVYLGLE